jgi:hypothetical protein
MTEKRLMGLDDQEEDIICLGVQSGAEMPGLANKSRIPS